MVIVGEGSAAVLTYEGNDAIDPEPRLWIDRIVSFVGEHGRGPFTDDHHVLLRPNHIVVGNPNRFTTGPVAIQSDDEWHRGMSRRDQALVKFLTMPVNLRFRYPQRAQRQA